MRVYRVNIDLRLQSLAATKKQQQQMPRRHLVGKMSSTYTFNEARAKRRTDQANQWV